MDVTATGFNQSCTDIAGSSCQQMVAAPQTITISDESENVLPPEENAYKAMSPDRSLTVKSGYRLKQSYMNAGNDNLRDLIESEGRTSEDMAPSVNTGENAEYSSTLNMAPRTNSVIMKKRGKKSAVSTEKLGSVLPLEDLILHYFHRVYPSLDPYMLSNELKAKQIGQVTMTSLKNLAKQEMFKHITELEIEKLLVERNPMDKRNLDLNKFLEALSLKRTAKVILPKLKENVIQSWTKEKPKLVLQ